MTCVSELCANAIAHTASGRGGVFTVEVDGTRDGVAGSRSPTAAVHRSRARVPST